MSILPMQSNIRDRISGLSGGLSGMDNPRNPLPNRPMPSMPTPMPNRIGGNFQPKPNMFQRLGQRMSDPNFLMSMSQRFGPKPSTGMPQQPQLNPGPFQISGRFGMQGRSPMMRRAQMDIG